MRELKLESLRAHIGLVTHSPLIFDGTILENIRYGSLYAQDEDVMAAAELAGLDEYVRSLPDGCQTVLTRGGSSLSGGQRQKIALARVLLKRPRIVIFDEATANLDVQAEQAFYRRFREACPDATVLVVTHRPWLATHAELVMYMEQGRVIGVGNHKQLLRQCPPYRRIMEIVLSPSPSRAPAPALNRR